MLIDEDTVQRDLLIAGMPFKVPAPFTEGYTLNSNEAAAMNQLLGENLRNNFAAKIKKDFEAAETANTPKASLEALQAELSAYAGNYEFGVRRSSSGSVGSSADPIDRELQKMARELVKGRLKEKGYKLKTFDDETIQGLCDKLIEQRPAMRDEAERRVNMLKDMAAAADDLGELPDPAAPAPAEA